MYFKICSPRYFVQTIAFFFSVLLLLKLLPYFFFHILRFGVSRIFAALFGLISIYFVLCYVLHFNSKNSYKLANKFKRNISLGTVPRMMKAKEAKQSRPFFRSCFIKNQKEKTIPHMGKSHCLSSAVRRGNERFSREAEVISLYFFLVDWIAVQEDRFLMSKKNLLFYLK